MSWNDVDLDSHIVETHWHVLSEGDYEPICKCATQKHLDYTDAVSYAHERINELQMNGYKEINQYHNRPNLEWELATDKGSITTVAVVEGHWKAYPLHGEYSDPEPSDPQTV